MPTRINPGFTTVTVMPAARTNPGLTTVAPALVGVNPGFTGIVQPVVVGTSNPVVRPAVVKPSINNSIARLNRPIKKVVASRSENLPADLRMEETTGSKIAWDGVGLGAGAALITYLATGRMKNKTHRALLSAGVGVAGYFIVQKIGNKGLADVSPEVNVLKPAELSAEDLQKLFGSGDLPKVETAVMPVAPLTTTEVPPKKPLNPLVPAFVLGAGSFVFTKKQKLSTRLLVAAGAATAGYFIGKNVKLPSII